MIYSILIVVGIVTGIAAGLFGFGGGFVIVPLVYHLFPATIWSAPPTAATCCRSASPPRRRS
jgi:uncharacterized membrane protein YfcA